MTRRPGAPVSRRQWLGTMTALGSVLPFAAAAKALRDPRAATRYADVRDHLDDLI